MSFSKVFNYLDKNQIEYFIIEIDYNKQRQIELEGEIDIVVHELHKYKNFVNHLVQNGWTKTQEFNCQNFTRTQLVINDFINNKFYKIDLINDFFYEKHNTFIKINRPIIKFIIVNNRKYLSGELLFNIYALKLLIEKNNIKLEKYLKILRSEQIDNNILFLTKEINRDEYDNKINQLDNKKEISTYKSRKIDFFSKISNFCNRFIFGSRIKKIAFIGLDGAGKSTIINQINSDLNLQEYTSTVCYFGHKEYYLNLLDKINKKSNKNLLENLIYILLWPIEIRLRYFFCIKKFNIILFDRHPFFEPVIPNNIKFLLIKPFYKLLEKIFIPKPVMIFYLTGDTKILWERKKENSFNDYIKRVETLEKIVNTSSLNVYKIKTDIPLEETIYVIKNTIIEQFNDIK